MAAGSTYTPIETFTVASAQSSYTFTVVPSTYTDLIMVINYANSSGTSDVYFQFNGDTAANYGRSQLFGDGSSAQSNRGSNETSFKGVGYSGTTLAQSVCQIMNYANTTTHKTILVRNDGTANNTMANVGVWRSTSAINSIKVGFLSNNFIVGSTFTLYGIAAA